MNHLKIFTIQEANKSLPVLTKLIDALRKQRDEILRREVEIDSLELVTERTADKMPPSLQNALDAYNRAVSQFYALIDQIHSMGCFLKDIDLGLVDFYIHHEGKVVYLCWLYGEPTASHWHEVGKGYQSRQPLE